MIAIRSIANKFAHLITRELPEKPTGYLKCEVGGPLAYWLPNGMTMEEINKKYEGRK